MRLCLGCYYRCSRKLDTITIELHVELHDLFWLSLSNMWMAKPGIYPFLRRVNTLFSGVEQKLGIFRLFCVYRGAFPCYCRYILRIGTIHVVSVTVIISAVVMILNEVIKPFNRLLCNHQ